MESQEEDSVKVFVGYGYRDRDAWIETAVIPLIKILGVEVSTGKEVHGESISGAIRQRIRDADACIGFTTRRDEKVSGEWTTHRWVIEELTTALTANIAVLEVREVGVEDEGGIQGDFKHYSYADENQSECLLEVAKAVTEWKKKAPLELKLFPQKVVDEIRPLLRRPEFRCSYKWIEGFTESAEHEADLKRITGGIFLQLKGVPPGALVQICLSTAEKSWTSDYEAMDRVGVYVQEDER